MSYVTNFKLSWTYGTKETLIKFVTDFCSNADFMTKLIRREGIEASGTWFRRVDDMRKLSWKFPATVFMLQGSGEDHPDLWVEYYMDGKVQHVEAEIIFADFDKNKLTTG